MALYQQRRNQLSPFFSKASVRTLEPLILSKINRLCARLEGEGSVVTLTHAFVALTVDVISSVCFGVSHGYLENKHFARDWYAGMVSSSRAGSSIRQFPWLHRLLAYFPRAGPRAARDGVAADTARQRNLKKNIEEVIERRNRGEKPPASGGGLNTIFDSMLEADVPASEKSPARLIEEAQTVMGAGAMTTVNALDTTFYHLLANPSCMERLAKELCAAIPDTAVPPSLVELEALPYLTAVVHEGLRLSKGVPHRFARVSPDVSYSYGDVVIPRGVAVGMSFMDFLERPDVFPDPDIFHPERWIPFDSPQVRQRRKSLVVFGGGTRMCLGLNLAWTELYMTVATVVRRMSNRLKMHDVVFERDVKITVDGFNALASRQSRGLRVTIQPLEEV
ncbi:hypothetical protein SLS62_007298 [Diatrype stigma]|uniref:Cytochrome P450 n=1 Tax=Diatrype stigma TaxID=117547 RepID=A0AAN9UPY1_9PEZI